MNWGDVVSDVFIFFPLLKYHPESLYLIVIFIVLSVLNEFAGIMGKVLGGERRYEGPMGKSDRALLIGVYGAYSLSWYFYTPLFSNNFCCSDRPIVAKHFHSSKKRTLCL